jgi:(2Fe-2S) ferredoxin
MEKPGKHILVCGSFRANGEPQGVCHRKGSTDLVVYIESELADRGLNDVSVSLTSCLKACDRGPVMVIHPDNLWYGGVESEDDVDAILDGLEDGTPAESYLMT